MPIIKNRFQVRASLEAVSLFHHHTSALKHLTPPPIFVQMREVEPLAEGSRSAFTLWFGPLPVRWTAVHSQVDPCCGFTDSQVAGPMRRWVHRHAWQPIRENVTQMEEQIEYEHKPGAAGLLTRLLFARPLLRFMLAYRQWAIQRALE